MAGYMTTVEIQRQRSNLTIEERRVKEKLLEAELAEYGVTRDNLDQAYKELIAECFAKMNHERRAKVG